MSDEREDLPNHEPVSPEEFDWFARNPDEAEEALNWLPLLARLEVREEEAQRLTAAEPPRRPSHLIPNWVMAAVVLLTIAAAVGGSYAVVEREKAKAREELRQVREVLEARSAAELKVRMLTDRARERLRLPLVGRRVGAQEMLLKSAEPRRNLPEDETTRELDLELRSAWVETLSVYDVAEGTGVDRGKVPVSPFALWPVAMAPDGGSLVIGLPDRPLWWKRGRPCPALEHVNPTTPRPRLGYSPDGRYLLFMRARGGLELWDREATSVVGVLARAGGPVFLTALVTADGKTVLGCAADGTVRSWSLPKQEEAKELVLPGRPALTAAAFTSQGDLLATGTAGGAVRLIGLAGGKTPELAGLDSYVESLAWSPDGQRLAVGTRDGLVRIYRRDGALVHQLLGFATGVGVLFFSPDGAWVLAGQRNQSGRIWDAATGELLLSGLTPLSMSSDGRRMATGNVGNVRFADVLSPTVLVPYRGHRLGVVRMAWAADHEHFATLDNSFEVRVWKVGRPVAVRAFHPTAGGLYPGNAMIALSEDGRYLGYAGGGAAAATAMVYDVPTGNEVHRWALPGGFETAMRLEGPRAWLIREEKVPGRSALQSVERELVPGRPVEKLRMIRPAAAGDEEGYYYAGFAAGRYWWVGPRAPLTGRRVEVWDVATGKVVRRVPITADSRQEPGALMDDGGTLLWVGHEDRTRRFEIDDPGPGKEVASGLDGMSVDRAWTVVTFGGTKDDPRKGFWLMRSERPELTFRGTGPNWLDVAAPSFSRNARWLGWGHKMDGLILVADLHELQKEIGRFESRLRGSNPTK